VTAPTDQSTASTFTVPGTDIALRETNGKLVTDGHSFDDIGDGIWDLIRPERRSHFDRFACDYAAVRIAEGREMEPAEVQALPQVYPDHPIADMWRQRAQSHARFKSTLTQLSGGAAVDIGAGCGWLAADLARDGWQATAVDVTVEGGDGLAAARYHSEEVQLARAEMEALPFGSQRFDMAVFNASLHYAGSVTHALDEAVRVLRPGGKLVVLDSPVFSSAEAGRAMVDEFAASAAESLGLRAAAIEGPGYVLDRELARFDFVELGPTGGLRQRLHQWRGARRTGRETARRPVLVATIGCQS